MRVPILACLTAISLSVLSPVAHAAWTGFKQLGATTFATSEVSCAPISNGKVACAVTDQAHKLAVNVYSANVWSGWMHLPEQQRRNPSCTERAAGEVICAVRGPAMTAVYQV